MHSKYVFRAGPFKNTALLNFLITPFSIIRAWQSQPREHTSPDMASVSLLTACSRIMGDSLRRDLVKQGKEAILSA